MTNTGSTIISVTLPESTSTILQQRAEASGLAVAELAGRLIQDALRPTTAPVETSLDEILRPIRDRFDASGMTDDELDALVEESRKEIQHDRLMGKPV